MARRRAARRAVRAQLRGGRREQHPARRPGVGSISVGDHRRAAVARQAPHEHGVDLRVRLACGLLAHLAAVRAQEHSAHRLRRRDRAGAQRGSRRRDERGGLGDREPRPQVDRVQGFCAGRGTPASRRGDPHPHRGDRLAPARLVSRSLLGAHAQARDGGGRLPLRFGQLRRRPALLGRRAEAASRHPLYARRQRHAFCGGAGLQRGRPVLRLPARFVRRALCRRPRRAKDAFGRPALPPGRAARTPRRARALHRPCARAQPGLGDAPDRHRAALARASPAQVCTQWLAMLSQSDHARRRDRARDGLGGGRGLESRPRRCRVLCDGRRRRAF